LFATLNVKWWLFCIFTPCSEICVVWHFGRMHSLHKRDYATANDGSISPIPSRKESSRHSRTKLPPPLGATLSYHSTTNHMNNVHLGSPSTSDCIYILYLFGPWKETYS
jgi:hypothetical protein